MDIKIVDITGNVADEADVPADVAAGRIMPTLVKLLGLPLVGHDGSPMSYRFLHKRTGRQIGDHESLASVGVIEGDTLRLLPEMTAG